VWVLPAALPFFLLFCAAVPAGADEWKLPVVTLRYETARGVEEEEEEGTLEPSYTRNTLSLRVKEELGRRFRATLVTRLSGKDFQDPGEDDYWYLAVVPGLEWSFGSVFGLGTELSVRSAEFDGTDAGGLSRDYLDLGSRFFADWKIRPNLKLDAWLRSTYSLYENELRTRQAYSFAVGLTGRWGQWTVGARYRGIARFPLGDSSEQQMGGYHLGSLNVSWDPNR
jgi:hypothetical protein